jgi:trigger factor
VFTETPEEEPINVTEVDVVLGGDGVQDDFTTNLTDVSVDDVKEFRVQYAEDFTSKGLAGKTVDYTAKITAVRVKELPTVDDEWARSLGEEYESVDILREKVLDDLQNRARQESEQRLRGDVMNKLVDAHPFEVPLSLVDYQASQLVESVARDMMMRGVDPRGQEASWWNEAREQLKPQATRDLRGSMLLETIAEKEKIDVTDDEIDAEITAAAEASRHTKEEVRDALTKQGGERSIADRLRNRKALDLIVENARITDEEWREEAPVQPEEEATQETSLDQDVADAEAEEAANPGAAEDAKS